MCPQDRTRPASCHPRARKMYRWRLWPCTSPRATSGETVHDARCSGSSSPCCSPGLSQPVRHLNRNEGHQAVTPERNQWQSKERTSHADILEEPRHHECLKQQSQQVDPAEEITVERSNHRPHLGTGDDTRGNACVRISHDDLPRMYSPSEFTRLNVSTLSAISNK